jgi:hypothetical protein
MIAASCRNEYIFKLVQKKRTSCVAHSTYLDTLHWDNALELNSGLVNEKKNAELPEP